MIRSYNGWIIHSEGGFMTIKRFVARRLTGEWHWAFRLKDCKELCDMRDNGKEINKLYLTPLYL